MGEKSIADLQFDTLLNNHTFHPSPEIWADQALYFLLVDRFSDGQETNYRDNEGKRVAAEGYPFAHAIADYFRLFRNGSALCLSVPPVASSSTPEVRHAVGNQLPPSRVALCDAL